MKQKKKGQKNHSFAVFKNIHNPVSIVVIGSQVATLKT